MKKALSLLSLAALTIGLLGSCSKINERIDGLDNRVGNIENEKIASIENQIAAINASIADLGTIRQDILDLQVAVGAKGEDITELKAADEALGKRIDELQTYVDTELAKYATTEWANATFATLEQLKTTNTELGALKETVGKLGETFDGKLSDLKTELTDAISTAVSNLETRISALEARVSALEAMIQSVTITPAYSDGSVEAVDGILTLKCIVSPAEALTGMESLKDSLLIFADSVKVKTKAATSAYMEIKVSEASVLDAAQGAITLTADISEYLPKGEGKALTVAVNIKNGISDFTTEFVPVYATKTTFKAVYDTNGGANTLTFYFDTNDHSGEGITVYEDGTTNYLFDNTKESGAKWGYNGKRGEIKSVVIDAYVAGYKGLTSTAYMFQGMTAASDISGAEYLDVSNVTDMNYMFFLFGSNSSTLNTVPDVSEWNTGKVTNMTAMFAYYGNKSELDKVPDVSKWNTAEVKIMSNMFQDYGHESQNFNAVPDVSNWDTGKAEDMHKMFQEYGHKSTALNTVPNVSGWNTSNVTNMSGMFNNYGSKSTNISCVLDLVKWDLSKITGTNGNDVFNFNPKTFDVTIPAKTGEKSNEGGKWYYGNGANNITPPAGKTFTPLLPAGALKGVFTVNTSGKKVHFSQGNLQATYNSSTSTYTWGFAANQYDFIGNAAGNTTIDSQTNGAVVDLFGWSTDATYNNWGIHTKKIRTEGFSSGNFKDWGTAIDGNGTWRTLSNDEWTYLINNNNDETIRKDKYKYGVTVCEKTNCLILVPDECLNGYSFDSAKTNYTADEWATAEAAGLVCLPAAGGRFGSLVRDVGGNGSYWSSTAVDGNAYSVSFNGSNVNPVNLMARIHGYSVRLVTEVPAAGDPGNGTEQYDPQVW